MLKNLAATIGIVAIVGAIVVWQFEFFSAKAKNVSKQVERATAAARAEKEIANYQAQIDSLDEKVRKYRVEARTMELAVEREQKNIDSISAALTKLGAAANEAGLPKPSAASQLTDEQANKTFAFNGKTISGAEIYTTAERWFVQLQNKRSNVERQRETIERMRDVSKKLLDRKETMTLELAKMRARLQELEAAKDVAEIEAELATIEANLAGVDVGKSGQALQTLQDQIDELNAIADSYREESLTEESTLSPNDLLQAEEQPSNELDEFWN